MGLKGFPAPKYHYFLLKMAPSTYFFVLNSKMASKITLGHSLMTQNAPSRLYPVYQFWQVSKVECAKQGVFLEGKIGKTEKKIQKFLLSQIIQNIILINYIPIKAILTPLVSRKNAKNCQNGCFLSFLTCFRLISWLFKIQWLVFIIVWVQWRVIETLKLSKKPF